LGLALPWRPWSPAPEPREVFWSGAEILGFPPATIGEAASADCSDMLDRLDARDAARLSSTSPSSDSSEIPRWCCARGPGSRPGVVWRETLLSFRNWSRKDIWEEGRSPSTTGAQSGPEFHPGKASLFFRRLRKYHRYRSRAPLSFQARLYSWQVLSGFKIFNKVVGLLSIFGFA